MRTEPQTRLATGGAATQRRRSAPVVAGSAAGLPPPSPFASSRSGARTQRGAASPEQREVTWSLEDAGADMTINPDREAGRRLMRDLSNFSHRRWAFHRSTDRYWRHLAGIFQSRIGRQLFVPLSCAGGTAAAICAYETLLRDGALPAYFPSFVLPSLPFDFTAFALSLLLVFRTNTSYDRWQAAINAWGDISTRSRDTLRQLLAYTSATPAAAAVARDTSAAPLHGAGGSGAAAASAAQTTAAAGKWLVAFSRSLKAQLTEDSDLQAELKGVLTAGELELLTAAYHRPSFALAVLSELVAAAPVRDSQRARLDENLTTLEDMVGGCERLLRTPIPLSYTRHTSRFMVIWLSCLPLCLWNSCGWGTVPLTVVISFLLLGIEEIGVAIEEPFSIMPLHEMCAEMECGLADILEQAAPSKRAAAQAAAAAALTAASAAVGGSADAPADASGGGGGGGSTAGAAPAPALGVPAAAANSVAPFVLGMTAQRLRRPLSATPRPMDAIFCSMDDPDAR
ncbi:UPF0187 chloroplastic [Micractinium conductrix]|uniref:UPF0187 chloroplastic n=1 Tax=Micractinium conductrix TaxID=554055 RepID=A0A2P6VKN7_9CHLO|nr:UPF0187 chloroplastic [Micractinium conductrix]|eukprot:PSC74666.1 UPF0187 chloroplastic [Micractinium conductrix]